jgi:hypothetical protein
MSTDQRRRVPEDLMGTILGASPGLPDQEDALPESGDAGGEEATVSWEDNPELVGVAFNLSKQLTAELDRVRHELEEDTHPSKSEIAEVALRIAVEDVRARGRESELVKRLEEHHAAMAAEASGDTPHRVVRGVDQTGLIIETTYDESGGVLDEDVVGRVADLPVMDEYLDEQGRLVSQVQDDLGNTFEQVLDDSLNILETRLLDGS